MGRRRGEPQQTVSSGGTTAGRHSQKGAGTRERRASRQDEEERGEGREGEGRGERGGSATMWRQGPALQRSQGLAPRT